MSRKLHQVKLLSSFYSTPRSHRPFSGLCMLCLPYVMVDMAHLRGFYFLQQNAYILTCEILWENYSVEKSIIEVRLTQIPH